MEHIWSVLCRLSIVDQQRNNVSLIDVMEQLSFVGEVEEEEHPLALPFPIELVTLWSRTDLKTPEVSQARVLILSPKGEFLDPKGAEYDIDLTEYQRFRAMGKFGTLPYVGDGIYRFVVQNFDEKSEQWRDVASIPLEIVKQNSPEENSD